MSTVPFFCGKDCGGNACPLVATVVDGCVTRVTNSPAGGTFIKGCRRGFDMPLEQYARDRLLTPLIRTGPRGSGQFREATWDEALNLTANRLSEIRDRYGATAVMNQSSAGVVGALHGTGALLRRFLTLFGGYTQITGSYSNGAAQYILPYVLGQENQEAGFDAATMKYSQMIILWGANVLETRMGTEVPQRIIEAKKCGKQIVVIDPRRSPTVMHAAMWWLPCRPGTDAALMLAVLHVLISENLLDRPFIATHSAGFDQLERYIMASEGGEARSPAWAAPICGIAAEEIVRFAHAYAAARPAMMFPGYSIQRVFAGEEPYRLTVALQVATGNFGQLGGSTGALNNRLPEPRVGKLPVPAAAPQPSVTVARQFDAILHGRAGGYPTDIHAVYALGGNALNQSSDIRKNIAAMERMDFVVSHNQFLTPTARYCDVVFPAATAFEKEDIGLPWAGNYLLYKPQITPPLGQARSDYDALCALADRLGFYSEFSEGRSTAQWIERFIAQSEIPDADEFRRTGIYLAPDRERTGLVAFTEDPHGCPLSTPSGKVEIASARYHRETGFPAIPTWQQPPANPLYPLRLITPKSAHYTHSQSNIPEIRRRAHHALTLHTADAAERGIVDGDTVCVFNAQGETRVPVILADDIMQGVASLPEGMWVDLDAEGVDVGGAANMLTETAGTKPGVCVIMHAIGVDVRKVEKAASRLNTKPSPVGEGLST